MSAASIRIVIAALGGEGGGVLGKWIADMADRNGYQTQTTSVPGVAQRTGATIYYLELFPRTAVVDGSEPVLSMFPAPGDVDLVICSEIVEAGRMVQRGFVTPGRTTLISSTHRSFGIAEKQHWADGSADKLAIATVCEGSAKRFIGFDMQATARAHDSVINAALFGAIAATQLLPFPREAFEKTIRAGKIAIESNLATFAAAFEQAEQHAARVAAGGVEQFIPEPAPQPQRTATSAAGEALLARIEQLPEQARGLAWLGAQRLADYQDSRYAADYVSALEALPADAELVAESARHLALWMAFEDLPRVAQLKIRSSRFSRYREEVKASAEQPLHMVEFLHPRVEEFCGLMPRRLGLWALSSAPMRKLLGLFAKPRHFRTNHLSGFLAFYLVAGLRRFRRGSLAFHEEQQQRQRWFDAVVELAGQDLAAARELAECGRFVKGYSDTRERGLRRVNLILDAHATTPRSAEQLIELRQLAVADEDGSALRAALAG